MKIANLLTIGLPKGKKASGGGGGVVAILIIIIVIALIAWMVDVGNRECDKDSECSENQYCGADFTCHSFPVVEKNVYQINLVWPALIVALGIFAAALIVRWKRKDGDGGGSDYGDYYYKQQVPSQQIPQQRTQQYEQQSFGSIGGSKK